MDLSIKVRVYQTEKGGIYLADETNRLRESNYFIAIPGKNGSI